ncbi:MAG TPA: MFS transporter [Vicinamibacterales bacterium]|nr:MFS transporter [Vicinamibacterales bacterium]
MSERKVAIALSATLVFSMAGFSTFSAVVTTLRDEWALSNTAIGWSSGIFYAGYTMLVPWLAAMSDRVDPRRILVGSIALSAAASAAFGGLANGLEGALACQLAGGIGLAGIYMPGVKALSDHVKGPRQGRYVSFYTSSFTIGTSASFLLAGLVSSRLGWRWAFGAAAIAQAFAALIVFRWVPHRTQSNLLEPPRTSSNPFVSVFRTREAMDYIVGYAAHMWELFAMRSWLVPFLAYSLSRQPDGAGGSTAAAAASIVTLVGVPASIGGQEVASRIGPRRHIVRTMAASAAVAAIVGWMAPLPFPVVVLLCSIYSITISADSAPLTAAAIAAAPPGARGATMAVHSTLGFAVAFAGSLAIGALLDLLGGDTPLAWGIAFIAMGASSALGVWRLRKL